MPARTTLSASDYLLAQHLCESCEAFELSELWCAAAADCGQCHGFPFRGLSDVQAQLGVCGCLIAQQMEMIEPADVPKRSLMAGDRAREKDIDIRLICKLLNLPVQGCMSREALYYLRSTRDVGRQTIRSRMSNKQMRPRFREKRDKAVKSKPS